MKEVLDCHFMQWFLGWKKPETVFEEELSALQFVTTLHPEAFKLSDYKTVYLLARRSAEVVFSDRAVIGASVGRLLGSVQPICISQVGVTGSKDSVVRKIEFPRRSQERGLS